MPPIINHTTNNQNGEPNDLAIPDGVRKIPTAITSPTINATAVRNPICRFSVVAAVGVFGTGWPTVKMRYSPGWDYSR
jgi:hypothetical protein